MATAPLSTVPVGIGTEPSASKEYLDALTKQLAALENRGGTNWFNMAAAFADPGRTGSFGESFGKAMGTLGKQQELEQERAPAIAQMRAQLAGQKYQVTKQAEALKELNAMAGVSPLIAEADLPAIAKSMNLAADDPTLAQFVGQPKSAFMSSQGSSVIGVNAAPSLSPTELKQALMAANNDPAAAMKLIYERQTKWGEPSQLQKDLKFAVDASTPPAVRQIVLDKLTNEAQRLNFDLGKFAAESGVKLPGAPSVTGNVQPPAGGKPAEFTGEIMPLSDLAKNLQRDFGLKPEQLSLERTREQQDSLVKRHAAGEPGIYTPAKTVPGKETYHENAIDVPTSVPATYMEARGYYRPDPKGDPVHWIPRQKAATPSAETAVAGGQASEYQYPDGTPIIIPSTVPPAKHYEYAEKRLGEYQQNVEKAEASTGKIYEKKLETIGTLDPVVLNKQNTDFIEAKSIINDPAVRPYLAKMFQQGLVPGAMTALSNGIKVGPWSASVDVYDIWLRSLPPEIQAEVKRLDQIMGTAYMSAVSAKPFGAAPSNFEDLQMKNTMATAKDPYKIINNFLNEQTIANTHLIDMRNRFDEFNTNKAKNIQPYGFFGTPSYKESVKLFNDDYKAYKTIGAR